MKFIKALLSASILAFITVPAMAKQDVVWWDFLGGGDGVRMKALINDFNAEHPDIQIKGTTLEWGEPFYTKVRTSASVGEAPDVMTYHLSRIPLGLEEGVLSPITDDDLANAKLNRDDFFPSTIAAASGEDGKLYAVPFDIHALILYYNKDLLKDSPYLDADGKLTGINSLDDFEKALAWLKEKGVKTPLTYQTGGEGGVWRVFYTLLSQQGGEFIVDGKVLPDDNAEKAIRAIEIMTRWQKNGWAPEQAEYEASVALYSSGDSAFQLNGVWEVPTFKDLEDKGTLGFQWGAVEIPSLMGKKASWSDSHAFAIPNEGDKTISGEKRAAVMTVIGWMERQSLRWAGAGHIPAYRPVAESDEYKALEPNATYASLTANTAFDPRSKLTGVASPTYDMAANIISPAMHGYLSAPEAVEQMQQELQGMMR